jgi:hypothetical protein
VLLPAPAPNINPVLSGPDACACVLQINDNPALTSLAPMDTTLQKARLVDSSDASSLALLCMLMYDMQKEHMCQPFW